MWVAQKLRRRPHLKLGAMCGQLPGRGPGWSMTIRRVACTGPANALRASRMLLQIATVPLQV